MLLYIFLRVWIFVQKQNYSKDQVLPFRVFPSLRASSTADSLGLFSLSI